MKKILTSKIIENIRRQPFTKASYEHLQQAYGEALEGLARGLAPDGITILHGCQQSVDGGDHAMTPGAAIYGGEVYQVPRFGGTQPDGMAPVWLVSQRFIPSDPVRFSDNSLHKVHAVNELIVEFDTPGRGIAPWDQVSRFDNLPSITGNVAALARDKADKKQPEWTRAVPPPAQGNTRIDASGVYFRRNDQGQIQFKGVVEYEKLSTSVSPFIQFFKFPAGFLPRRNISIVCAVNEEDFGYSPANVDLIFDFIGDEFAFGLSSHFQTKRYSISFEGITIHD